MQVNGGIYIGVLSYEIKWPDVDSSLSAIVLEYWWSHLGIFFFKYLKIYREYS